MNLRHAVAGFGDAALVAQRLKRMSSIEAKLRRSHHMQLARMHDMGGCRALLPSASDVLAVVRQYDRSRALHEPLRRYDYLTSPRDSGYRGVHLVYGYRTKSDAHAAYSGMRIEIQLRSRLQHAWATAVETVGTFSGQALKSSEGNEAWLRFFSLMATELACTEGLPPVPGTPADRGKLRRELAQLAAEINAVARLEAYGRTLRILEGDIRNGRAAYFHIYLDLAGQNVRWNEYSADEREEAIQAYEEVETAIRRFPRAETVLVQVGSVEALRRAYPNYFADTSVFVGNQGTPSLPTTCARARSRLTRFSRVQRVSWYSTPGLTRVPSGEAATAPRTPRWRPCRGQAPVCGKHKCTKIGEPSAFQRHPDRGWDPSRPMAP